MIILHVCQITILISKIIIYDLYVYILADQVFSVMFQSIPPVLTINNVV